MCGIAGIFAYAPNAPRVDRDELLAIRDSMEARGPDGTGVWISPGDRVGLAHRRLAVIDLSRTGAQPMSSPDSALHLVFNGEIYNYRELRIELERLGHTFRTHSDTEVLLHCFEQFGTDMLRRLRGMYAFALWDSRASALYLARDGFGIKPLYYADDGRVIRVASQVKALLKSRSIDTRPEPAGHVGFFLWGHIPDPYTLYKGVRALPAGTCMRIDSSGRRQSLCYFNIAEEMAGANATGAKQDPVEVSAHLRHALLDSVRSHLVADVPVATFLSSGIDSATLVALTGELSPEDVRSVTLGFREFSGSESDETALAGAVAAQYGARHQELWTGKREFENSFEQLKQAMDQPSIDGVNSFFVSRAAAQAGYKVVMSGVGGDELFGGYPSFRDIPRMVRAMRPFLRWPALAAGFRVASAKLLRYFTSPKFAGLLEYGGRFEGAYLLRRGLYMPWELAEFLDGDMVREGWNELCTLSRLQATIHGIDSDRLRVSALELSWYMKHQLLRDTDWASMAHSVEVRLPFVDIQLFRLIAPLLASTPPLGKGDLARTPRRPLPKAVLAQKKKGFSVPIRNWLLGVNADFHAARGLRGWAQLIYRGFAR